MYNPTSLHFGKGVIAELPNVVNKFGKKALLLYGKNSIKENGIYDQVVHQLKIAGIDFCEYSGIKSNPVITDVDAAAETGRKNHVDMIIAVGGGSVIDSAKIISLAIPIKQKAWNLFEYKVKPTKAIPLIAVLTLAATGTEMNPFAVVQNNETKQKPGYFSPLIYPMHSFLDPSYTLSVPADYTSYGIVDLVAHALEGFFGTGDATLTDKLSIAVIKEALEYGPLLMKNLDSYVYREKIMYAATLALNGLTAYGKKSGDWGVHSIGHALSVLYDIPHGASLSVIYPAWMKHFKNQCEPSLIILGTSLFGVNNAYETIEKFEEFFMSVKAPVRMNQLDFQGRSEKNKVENIVNNLINNKSNGYFYKMEKDDFENIIKLAL